MRITTKGQVTIPQDIRERAGLLPNTEVEFVLEAGEVVLKKATEARRSTRGSRAVRLLREHGGGVRMTTDEILALTRAEP